MLVAGRTRASLAALGVRPRRHLGQSFLADPRIARRIIAAAAIGGESVVEIGPGLGALSDPLAEAAGRLLLVEIDPSMAAALRKRFAERASVTVVTADALAIDFAPLVPPGSRAVVVANLPYSVGSQILLRLLEERRHWKRLVLMMQREVAERLTASPGTRAYGLPTIWTAVYGRPRLLFRVSAGAFVPRPKVESAVLEMELQDEPRFPIADEARFRELVRASFAHRRKTLGAALERLVRREDIERAGFDPRRRGETLTPEEFAILAAALPMTAARK
jgi:16S rRNA (adenine1518-N6/adenine1519-N6)-dimethyltransferase